MLLVERSRSPRRLASPGGGTQRSGLLWCVPGPQAFLEGLAAAGEQQWVLPRVAPHDSAEQPALLGVQAFPAWPSVVGAVVRRLEEESH